MIEPLDDIGAEEKPGPSRRETPSVDLVRVAPQKVAHGTFVGDFLFAIQETDFIHAVDERGETAMDTEDSAAGAGCATVTRARGAGAGGAGLL